MSTEQVLRLAEGLLQRTPFLHAVVPNCIDHDLAESLLSWFEREAPWQWSAVDNFYHQFDVDLRTTPLPADLKLLVDDLFLEELRQGMGRLLEARLDARIDVTAHRMLLGCRVGIHTDYVPAAQAYRLLVHLNRGWKPEDGGLLMLFGEKDPTPDSEGTRCYSPQHGRAFAFEISPRSFHAVSRICMGERYALRFSFYADR
jgi:Rps23 Pro-64 3,4-dihydroxylase Tpa1-like proline 4-hydroxylase